MLGENISLALHAMLASKMRTFLTMLGIIIGIASVISITTIGNSSVEQTKKEYSQMGTNIINFSIYQSYTDDSEDDTDGSDTSYGTDSSSQNPGFTKDMMTALVKRYGNVIDQIIVSNYMPSGKAVSESGTNSSAYANVQIQGVNNGYLRLASNNVNLVAGSVFAGDDLGSESDACIVSDRLVDNLFGGDYSNAIGQQVSIPLSDQDLGSMEENASDEKKNYTFRIVGVYQSGISAQSMQGAGSIKDIMTALYIPYTRSQVLMKDSYSKTLNYFQLNTKPGSDVFKLTDEIKDYLTTQIPSDMKNCEIYADNNATYIQQAEQAVRQRNLQTLLVAAIALLVGGIGVMNIMTVSIMERTREIGTRKALGATNSDIRWQFITEAVLMCLIGGAIGIASGVVIGIVACRVQYITPYVSMSSIWVSFLVSMAIGVFFGYYPAAKAAKMDPIEALRYE